jgi:hypothetical protein
MEQPISNHEASVQTGKSSDPLKMWAMVLAVLLLVAASVAAWAFLQVGALNSKVSDLEATTTELTVSKTSLQGQLDKLNGDGAATDATSPDSAKIIAAADLYMRRPKASTNADFEYTIIKTADGFSRVSAGFKDVGGGVAVWVKKVGDNWVGIIAGQENPAQADIDLYGIPQSVLFDQ